MKGVTISAGYGTGGSLIAPAVADRLGLPLLDRAISSDVAQKLHVTVPEAQSGALKRSLVGRFFDVLAPFAGGVLGAGTDAAPPDAAVAPGAAEPFREQAELIMRNALRTGAVILGRAGAAAFCTEPDILRVRLYGPLESRVAHACRVQNLDEATARRLQPEVDRARAQYVRRLYSADIDDSRLYTLQLESTALRVDTCVDIIVTAYAGLLGRAGSAD